MGSASLAPVAVGFAGTLHAGCAAEPRVAAGFSYRPLPEGFGQPRELASAQGERRAEEDDQQTAKDIVRISRVPPSAAASVKWPVLLSMPP